MRNRTDEYIISDFALVEYSSLREEILKRIELQHQLVSLALIVAGTIATVGVQFDSAITLLAYPFIAFCLASLWIRNNASMRQIGSYIMLNIETLFDSDTIGFEHKQPYMQLTSIHRHFGSLERLTARGVFVGTQIVTLVIAYPLLTYTFVNIMMMVISVLSIILTMLLISRPVFETASAIRNDGLTLYK